MFPRWARPALFLLFATVLVGSGALYWMRTPGHPAQSPGHSSFTAGSQAPQQTVAAQQVRLTGTPTPMIAVANGVKQFAGLGVKLSVSATDRDGHDLPISVNGNKILVGPGFEGVPYYVQVFTKQPDDSLQSAIASQFHLSPSSADCGIRVASALLAEGFPATFQKAQIYPISDPTRCPADYESFDIGRFFLMDTNHPNVYVFVQYGQVPIYPTVAGKDWEQTISFQ